MVDAIIFFLPAFIGFTCAAFGFSFQNYILLIFGGLLFLGMGVATIVSPIPDLSVLSNVVVYSLYFGLGAYLTVAPSVEWLQENM